MENITNIRLSSEEYAKLRGCSVRYIERLCIKGKIDYEDSIEATRGGKSGISYRIPLASLSDKEIELYLRQQRKLQLKEIRPPEEDPEGEDESYITYEQLSAAERSELNQKNKLLDNWLSYRFSERQKGGSFAAADENYIRIIQLQYPELDISLRTLHRWDKVRRTKGEMSLIDRRGRHGQHNTKFDPEIFDLFQYYYLDESRKDTILCMNLVKAELRRREQKELIRLLPSERTFERWIQKYIPFPMLQYFRFGEKACKDKCLPYIHRSYDDLKSNDIWVCDNHTFDIIVTDGEKPMRVYLTGFLDVRSRKIVGYYVTLTPSADATMYALRNGIERYGIPKRILSDNGREFLTFDIGGRGFRKHGKLSEFDPETVMERLGIEFKTALVRNARAKIIERCFLTVKEEFSKLFEAYTGGNVLERPERLKYIEKDIDNLTVLQDFESFVSYYIEGYYNFRQHKGVGMNGMTPNQVYARNLYEQRRASKEELNIMLLRSTRLQKVTRAGVKLNFYGKDIYYINQELIINHQGEKVYVRYNPAELDEVRVYDSEDRYLLTARQDRELSYFASKEEIAEAMKEQRQYQRIVSAYMRDKNIKAGKALDLIMATARDNLRDEEELNPKIITIMRSPDADYNELCIQKVAGFDEPLDFAVANRRLREQRERNEY